MVGGKLRGVHCTVQVWRREHERLPGLYRYKLYGHFQVPGNSHNHWGGPSQWQPQPTTASPSMPGCDHLGVPGSPARPLPLQVT